MNLELTYAQCACMFSAGKMTDRMYGHSREGVLILWVSGKALHFLTFVAC